MVEKKPLNLMQVMEFCERLISLDVPGDTPFTHVRTRLRGGNLLMELQVLNKNTGTSYKATHEMLDKGEVKWMCRTCNKMNVDEPGEQCEDCGSERAQ